jgi:hypothetical protein
MHASNFLNTLLFTTHTHHACLFLQVLQAACPPANACSPSLAPAVGPVQHTPNEQGWEQLLTGAVGVLRAGEAPQQNPGVAGVDTGFARQEFISGGQQVRDCFAVRPVDLICCC